MSYNRLASGEVCDYGCACVPSLRGSLLVRRDFVAFATGRVTLSIPFSNTNYYTKVFACSSDKACSPPTFSTFIIQREY